ncbi:DUF914 domain membrane protein [Aspergillus homomorphus CBS 101889]|uniref:DUF914-domain-containing protein n=1 Tax=Aspergillus homomorphus (strain CBS 101889) TaxID=1450537 RepID=A0A395HNX8_ASPHC|nr:DUF914-domain-containing protein [Aspergillus homomorphus CBS 101889]RAL07974.1 DUF914-domain-containing protein [Aspergillus homomorphus CBS 101889]
MTHSAMSHGTEHAGPSSPRIGSNRPPKQDVCGVASRESAANPRQQGLFAYLSTRDFYLTLLLGQTLAITNTACSTFSTLLADRGVSIPAFQTFFTYLLLALIFTTYTIYRHGLQSWTLMLLQRGWKYLLLSTCDVTGNYLLVLSYRHTTLLSAQLINFWAIAIVVLVSSTMLGVRYHRPQLLGITICIAGMLLLLLSDRSASTPQSAPRPNPLKGDVYALLGATSYGLANTFEEFLVSTTPNGIPEVLAQLGLFGAIFTGAQAVAFEVPALNAVDWDRGTVLELLGFTLCLAGFYALVPILLRRASAAFFNLSMLTMNCWGVLVGVLGFRYRVGAWYPLAFALVVAGQGVYYLGGGEGAAEGLDGVRGRKPWLEGSASGGFQGQKEEDPEGLGIEPRARRTRASAGNWTDEASEEDPLLGPAV